MLGPKPGWDYFAAARSAVLLATVGGVVAPFMLFVNSCGGSCASDVSAYAARDVSEGAIVVVGDIQRTSWFAHALFSREQNDDERVRLVAAMAKERPSIVVLLGDLVFKGASCGDWTAFDDVMEPIRKLNVPVLAALGNHEYRGANAAALAEFHARFPVSAQCHWFSRRHGQLGLVWLDSNKSELKKEAWNTQQQWFERTLRSMDADPKVRGVLVFTHHPPYTNSIVTKDELDVQETFLVPFIAARKTLAFISGHAHGYERFVKVGKQFVVSAGGGGARVRYLSGKSVRHQDQYQGPAPRPFNYLLITHTPSGAKLVARGFDKGKTEIKQIDSVDMRFP
jgi:Icc-related predicted phosphoesterase